MDLDRSLPEQYLSFLGGLLRGDFGYSFAFKSRTVNELLRDTFPVSLQLGSMAFVLALGLGIPAGILAASRRGSLRALANARYWLGTDNAVRELKALCSALSRRYLMG